MSGDQRDKTVLYTMFGGKSTPEGRGNNADPDYSVCPGEGFSKARTYADRKGLQECLPLT